MGISDIVSKRSAFKTEPEVVAEKFLLLCKPGKAQRQRIRQNPQSYVHRLRTSMILVTNSHRNRRERHKLCIGHHCLYVSLRKCYENNLNELEIISNLLSEIYSCDGNLHAIFSILLPGHVIRSNVNINIHTLYPGFSTRIMRKHSTDAFEFYLHNLCEAKRSFQVLGKQQEIINDHFDNEESFTPLSAACMRRDPALILLLLRYGADAGHYERRNEDDNIDNIETLVSGLNSICHFTNTTVNSDTKEALVEEAAKGKLCLQYIFRTVRNIPFSQSSHFHTEIDQEELKKKAYSLHPRLAATMDTKMFSGVRSLQHMCRLSIRKTIQEFSHKSIPSSISSLILPRTLLQYLDLQHD